MRGVAARADIAFVEGVGGFRVPLVPGWDTADLAVDLGLPVVLVVGLRLGCINHALRTACHWPAGWPTRSMPPCRMAPITWRRWRRAFGPPFLGHVPRLSDPHPAAIAAHLPNALALLLAQQAA